MLFLLRFRPAQLEVAYETAVESLRRHCGPAVGTLDWRKDSPVGFSLVLKNDDDNLRLEWRSTRGICVSLLGVDLRWSKQKGMNALQP